MAEAAEKHQVAVHVFVNRKRVELDSATVTGADILEAAGFEGRDWRVLELKGEGDPTGGTEVPLDKEIRVKNGEHFRVLPGNPNFGG